MSPRLRRVLRLWRTVRRTVIEGRTVVWDGPPDLSWTRMAGGVVTINGVEVGVVP